MLYILTSNLKGPICNTLRRIASFRNPLYFKRRAMGLSTKCLTRIIPCFTENETFIGLPRGKREQLFALLKQENINIRYEDQREKGHNINASFTATLYPEQQKAATALLQHNIGILQAATAFGKTPLLLTKFKRHAEILHQRLQGKAQHIFLLHEGKSTKERKNIRTSLTQIPANESVVLIAIGQYIGEGFNYPRLDTLMLTTPISWSGNVEQYAGRLHRDYTGKKEVIIYDYADIRVPMLDRMYTKRLRTYKNMGYTPYSRGELFEKPHQESCFFDAANYETAFEKDLQETQKEIFISSPILSKWGACVLYTHAPELIGRGVRISITTLAPHVFPLRHMELTQIIEHLRHAGITVRPMKALHEHCAIIDKTTVWYGNANFLSRSKESDNVIRINDPTMAATLLNAIMQK